MNTTLVYNMSFALLTSAVLENFSDLKSRLSVGTFTLSNLGMFGVDKFDAILPAGQVCFFPGVCLVSMKC